jgi:thiosulfate reductase cytochrome b subunit
MRGDRAGRHDMTAAARALRPAPRVIKRHSALTRICHWINAVAFIALLMSGLQIFNAHPTLNFGQTTDFQHPLLSLEPNGFPAWATLPQAQDLAVGRRWHFFFAWLLVINGALYFGELFLRRHIRDFLVDGRELREIPRAIVDHARLRFPKGDAALHYNVLQKLAYLAAIAAFPALILAGLTMSPGMDSAFPWLLDLFGGRQSARAIHFLLAIFLVAFLLVHLAMVALSGPINNVASMITGRYRIEEDDHVA